MSAVVRGLRDAMLAGGFAAMGAMKLAGAEWEVELFRNWGQSDDTRKAVGVVEALSAVLLLNRSTRRLGAASMALVSVPTLMKEIDSGRDGLAALRFALLGMAVSSATDPVRLRRPSRATAAPRRPASLPSAQARRAAPLHRLAGYADRRMDAVRTTAVRTRAG